MRVSIPGQRPVRKREAEREVADTSRDAAMEYGTELSSAVSERNSLPKVLPKDVVQEKTLQSIRNRHVESGAEFMSDLDVTAKQIVSIQERFLKAGVGGRKMTEEVVLEILNRLCRGETLKQICQDVDMPAYGTVQKWYATDPDFQAAMDQARQFQMNLFADEILEIADNSVGDIRLAYDKNGNLVPEVNYENVKRSELRIKTRMELMKVFNRKQFGTHKETAPAVIPGVANGQLNIQIVLPDNGRQITTATVVDI